MGMAMGDEDDDEGGEEDGMGMRWDEMGWGGDGMRGRE